MAAVRRLTALDLPQLNGEVPESYVLGSTVDISAYAQFDWYEYVWYSEPTATFPNERKCLGRWLGIAEVSTDVMASYILTDAGSVIIRKSVWGVSSDDRQTEGLQTRMTELDEKIRLKIGDQIDSFNKKERKKSGKALPLWDPESPWDLWNDLNDNDVVDPFDPDATQPEANAYTPEACDEYLTAEVLLPHAGEFL